jgi:hypothetical protein
VCTVCPERTTNEAGDDASGADTLCDPFECVTPLNQTTDAVDPIITSFIDWIGYPAANAFDGTSALWLSAQNVNPVWLGFEFTDAPRFVEEYAITFNNGTLVQRAPRDFIFQGFDGVDWVGLDNRSDEIDWFSGERRVYTIATPGFYYLYRLFVVEDNNGVPGIETISIGELELIGCQ